MSPLRPTDRDTITALRIVAGRVEADCAYQLDGRFYFDLGAGWALALSPESAGRFRLGACYGGSEVATLWSRASDRRRLAELASSLRAEIDALPAQRG